MESFQSSIDFIRLIFNEPKEFIPLHAPIFIGNEKAYLNECIDTTFVSSVGKFVDTLELEMAKYTGCKRAIACVNGTNALHLALILAGVEQDDEVIMQPLTFIATANAISYCKAKPVFIDVDKETLGLSAQKLEEWLKAEVEVKEIESQKRAINKRSGKRISACIPMHTFGHPCRIDEIVEICNRYGIAIIEDAAESLGTLYKGKHTGTFAPIGVLSFNGNKTITTGGGGMLLFNDANMAQKAKHLSTQAKLPHAWEFKHDEIGYNYRMPNINAAIGLAQLEKLEWMLEEKRKLANAYSHFFKDSEITFFEEPQDSRSNYWLNCVILKDRAERDYFLEVTNQHGVMTRPIWELMNRLPMFQSCQCGDLENSIWLADRVVNIPSSVIIKT